VGERRHEVQVGGVADRGLRLMRDQVDAVRAASAAMSPRPVKPPVFTMSG